MGVARLGEGLELWNFDVSTKQAMSITGRGVRVAKEMGSINNGVNEKSKANIGDRGVWWCCLLVRCTTIGMWWIDGTDTLGRVGGAGPTGDFFLNDPYSAENNGVDSMDLVFWSMWLEQ